MALFNGREIGRLNALRAKAGALGIVFTALACGGQSVDDEGLTNGGAGAGAAAGMGGGSNASTVNSAGGSAPTCFGIVPTTKPCTDCVPIKLPYDDDCIITLAMGSNLRLNPELATLYFPGANGSRTEVPYVGKQEACATATTYGGWYASNTSGGDSDIGLCPCTCNAARQHEFKADIALAGIPH
ncbi:MAG TPA: hypothetical protein VIV60_35465 [Polyangiaceae bacterium]